MNMETTRGGRPRKTPVFYGPFSDLIRAKMEQLGMKKPEEFAAYAGIARSVVYSLMAGRQSASGNWVKPSLETLVSLSKALDLPLVDLLERLYGEDEVLILPRAPLVGYVGAGPGLDEELDDVVYLDPVKYRKGRYASYRVRGNSMCAGRRPICHGNIIVVNLDIPYKPNWEVVARLEDGSHICKLYKEGPGGAYLMSTNPNETNGTPAVIPASEVAELKGIVTEVRSFLS
jgi:repressor LexA